MNGDKNISAKYLRKCAAQISSSFVSTGKTSYKHL